MISYIGSYSNTNSRFVLDNIHYWLTPEILREFLYNQAQCIINPDVSQKLKQSFMPQRLKDIDNREHTAFSSETKQTAVINPGVAPTFYKVHLRTETWTEIFCLKLSMCSLFLAFSLFI